VCGVLTVKNNQRIPFTTDQVIPGEATVKYAVFPNATNHKNL
jgi:hypothetical protein